MNPAAQQLAFHGTIVLLFALLLGAPYARAIKSNAFAQVVNSWRVAHQSLSLGAAIMFSVAAVLPTLAKSPTLAWSIALCFIVSSYAFCIATPLAAITKDRGLASGASGLARLVYWGNIVGAASSLIGAIVLVFAAGASLL
ncbi:MAG: hypothetical protein EAZ43_16000 [Betaproteobacteria bacterium]|nr:MAG: hypothetical protein EAZ43_16000 [Betaproteobacteria bacterium]